MASSDPLEGFKAIVNERNTFCPEHPNIILVKKDQADPGENVTCPIAGCNYDYEKAVPVHKTRILDPVTKLIDDANDKEDELAKAGFPTDKPSDIMPSVWRAFTEFVFPAMKDDKDLYDAEVGIDIIDAMDKFNTKYNAIEKKDQTKKVKLLNTIRNATGTGAVKTTDEIIKGVKEALA